MSWRGADMTLTMILGGRIKLIGIFGNPVSPLG
jgi:hypothetical protein